MSKKTPTEKPQGVKTDVPEAGTATPEQDPQGAAAAGASTAAVDASEESDYRALYEQANDRWLRTRADFDNYRKRMQREMMESRSQAVMQTVAEFLRLYDQLGLALEHVRSATDTAAIGQGLELTTAEFDRILATLGVSRIMAAGKPFDPAVHEAVAQEPSSAQPAGTVLREWKAGFTLGDRLLRPATVIVSSGPADSSSGSADGAGNRTV